MSDMEVVSQDVCCFRPTRKNKQMPEECVKKSTKHAFEKVEKSHDDVEEITNKT